ncbi:MAG: hypothetical protein WA673_11695 [Candidatus Acidiferrales bacterium]
MRAKKKKRRPLRIAGRLNVFLAVYYPGVPSQPMQEIVLCSRRAVILNCPVGHDLQQRRIRQARIACQGGGPPFAFLPFGKVAEAVERHQISEGRIFRHRGQGPVQGWQRFFDEAALVHKDRSLRHAGVSIPGKDDRRQAKRVAAANPFECG